MAAPCPSWLSEIPKKEIKKRVVGWLKNQLKHSKTAWSAVSVITAALLWFGYTIQPVTPVPAPVVPPVVEQVEPVKSKAKAKQATPWKSSAIFNGIRVGADDVPVANIQGPDKVMLGQSVWLRTDGSYGFDMQWKVLPESEAAFFTQLPIYGGMGADGKPIVNYWVHYDSPNPGVVHAVFVTTLNDKVAIATHTFTNGGVTPVPPVPPVPPIPPVVPNDDLPEVREPSAQHKEWASPIISIITDKEDAIKLARFWLDMQDIITRNTELIDTTERIRELNVKAGKAAFANTPLQGKYPKLGKAMDDVLVKALGLEKVKLTPEKRMAASNACNAIAWACVQAAKGK